MQYNLALPTFVPNIKLLSQVVSEKSLTEKITDRYTNFETEKAKPKYPLYISYDAAIANVAAVAVVNNAI